MNSNELGRYGEDCGAEYLQHKGYRILTRNYKIRSGEIDIIALDHTIPCETYIVFVEVKLRKNSNYGSAREFVTREKQRKIRLAASYWLVSHPQTAQPRFDVLEIYAPYGTRCTPEINHLINAF